MPEDKLMTDVMLSIARDAIAARAAQDGCDPHTYDAAQDPEGYVVSLLIALQHWSCEHRLDWHAQLLQAHELFKQDYAEAHPNAVEPAQPTLEDLRCPRCGHRGCFHIEVRQSLLLCADGIELPGTEGERWDDTSSCTCPICTHYGTVSQFRAAHEKETGNGRHR
jgi:hypothetical protein